MKLLKIINITASVKSKEKNYDYYMKIKPIQAIVFLFMRRINNCSMKFRKQQLKLFELETIQCGGTW
jgi:hypothetical protein